MPTFRSIIALAFAALVALAMAWPSSPPDRGGLAGAVTTDFLPSTHGLPFRNPARNPSQSIYRQLTTEQCGGMVYQALDGYSSKSRPSATSARALSIQMRSLESIVSNGSRFLLWSIWPDYSSNPLEDGVVPLTREEELPKLRSALEKGPVPLGLVRARSAADVGLNHQVVAYRMERQGDRIVIGIYDPTQPGADDIVLVTDLGDPSGVVSERAGHWEIARWRGLFVERYAITSVPPR